MSIIPSGPSDFVIVNDSSPSTQVWDIQRGLFVANTGAGNYATWLSSGLGVGFPYNTSGITILSAASSDAGTTTTFTVPATTFGPGLSLTTGNTFNVQNTGGLYDGNQQFTVVDGTHLKIAVAFAGNATGLIVGAQIVATIAGLLAQIDSYNASLVPPSYLAVSSGVNYQIVNTPPLFLDFTPTGGGLSVTLSQMNVPGSLAIGRPLIIHNSSAFPFSLKNNSGSSFALFPTVPVGLFVHLYLKDNSTANGSFAVEQVARTVAVAPGDADAIFSIVGNPITTVVTTALTAPRTWTLGAANSGIGGMLVLVEDRAGAVTSTNTITIQTNGVDLLNGNAAGSVVLNHAFAWVLFETNGNNRYTIVGGKGALASTDLSDLPIPVASGGTGAASLTAHGILLGEGTSAVTPTAAMTNGQLLVGQTSADPLPKTVSGDAALAASGALTVSKFNGNNPIAVVDGGTNYTGGAWTTYTATITPNAGSITQGGSAAFLQIGKIVMYSIAVTVTNVSGGPPTQFGIALPVAVKRDTQIIGQEIGNTGLTLRASVAAGNTASSAFRDVTSPGFTLRAPTLNDEYIFAGIYEAN